MDKIYSVTQVTSYLKKLIGTDFLLRSLCVRGELSNVKYHVSGHIYFTVKDDGAALSGVMFASDTGALDFRLADGMKVEITGGIGVYEKAGSYQIYAKRIKREGRGELFERYLKLKEELEEMGMFSDEYKRPIPGYIKRLGVVTASTGAAVRDIINITRRRNPYVEIVLYPAKVQGEGAPASIAENIRLANELASGGLRIDTLIVGRGGGSPEDLAAFNDEGVARAIFASVIPVISAVGHESDFSISDLVADVRAETPTAAADMAVMNTFELREDISAYKLTLVRSIRQKIEAERLLLTSRTELLQSNMRRKVSDARSSVEKAMIMIRENDPRNVFAKGYAAVTDEDGSIIPDTSGITVGGTYEVRMRDGSFTASVTDISRKDSSDGR